MASKISKSTFQQMKQLKGIAKVHDKVSKKRTQRYEVMKNHLNGLPDICISSRSDHGSFYRKIVQALSKELIEDYEKAMKKMPLGDRTSPLRKWQILFKQLASYEEDIMKIWNLFLRSKETTKMARIISEEYQKQQDLNIPNGQIPKSKSCNDMEKSSQNEENKIEIPVSNVQKIQDNINSVMSNIEGICHDRAVQQRSELMNSLLVEILEMLHGKTVRNSDDNSTANDVTLKQNDSKISVSEGTTSKILDSHKLTKTENISEVTTTVVKKAEIRRQYSEVGMAPEREIKRTELFRSSTMPGDKPIIIQVEHSDGDIENGHNE